MLVLALAVASSLPVEIQDYYRDFSFANAFSTLQERRLIAHAPRRPPASERLARVASAMERLAGRVIEDDPGIMGARRPAPENTFRSELMRVRSFRIDAARGEAWVYLEALRLDRAGDVTLIASFDELAGGGRQPTTAELVARAGRLVVETRETHHWIRLDGQWRREGAVQQFIQHQR